MDSGPPDPSGSQDLATRVRHGVRDARRLLNYLESQTGHKDAGGAPISATRPAALAPDELRRRAQLLYDQRAKRKALFSPALFGEPAWEILLILYLAHPDKAHRLSHLAELSGANRSTGARWIDYLEHQGLVCREPHPNDLRVRLISLSDRGRAVLDRYLSELI